MGRFVATRKIDGKEVITIYEEGFKKKRIKREMDVPFVLSEMDRESSDHEYKWANKKTKRIGGN